MSEGIIMEMRRNKEVLTVVVNNVEELLKECVNRKVNIYGAKNVAWRTCCYLESKGIEIDSFVVSDRYDNPTTFLGKDVRRIEETDSDYCYECMIIAVGLSFIWEVEEQLQKYNICKLIIMHPFLIEKFPNNCILSNKSSISKKSFLGDRIQITSDESSTIIIEDNVVIGENVIISAINKSVIHIKGGVCIEDGCRIYAEGESNIKIYNNVIFWKGSFINIQDKSQIEIKKKVVFRGGRINCINNSEILLGEESSISESAFIHCYLNGYIQIGKKTTIGQRVFCDCKQSSIEVGEDNMWSYDVKIFTGTHQMLDRKSGKDITNRKPIKIGKHVWIGVKAILTAGSEIGNNSIVGAGTVVTKAMPAYVACAGNPARVVRENIDWVR